MRIADRASASSQRDAACGNDPAIGRHFSFYLEETTKPAGNARTRFEVGTGTGSGGEFERPEARNPQRQRGIRIAFSRCGRGQPAHLREHLDENHGRNDRLPRKVTIKVKICRDRVAATGRALAGDELRDPFDEPHRRLVRKKVEQVHHAVSVYFPPSDE